MGGKGLYITGGNGTMKTLRAAAVAKAYVELNKSVRFVSSVKLLSDFKDTFGTSKSESDVFAELNDCDLLVIDDLGTEIDNQYSVATLYNIINSRILAKKPTVISTNYDFRVLENKYDKRITSRITGEYVKMQLFGKDIRNS